ncbi:hypothetical protein R3P38DRAFT_2575975, partial [Favolaschia claudopus]
MVELLKQEPFRTRIAAYIQANLRAHLPGLETAQSVESIPVEKDIAYNPLIVSKSGGLRCKRRAPFTCHEKDFIEGGNWGQRRVYEFMNGWIPGILVNVRCNNDAKLLTNGRDTMNTTFYVAGYAAK